MTATPVGLEQLLERNRAETDAATQDLVTASDPLRVAQGRALRQLAEIHDESLAVRSHDLAAHELRFVLVAPWIPDRRRTAGGARPAGGRGHPAAVPAVPAPPPVDGGRAVNGIGALLWRHGSRMGALRRDALRFFARWARRRLCSPSRRELLVGAG